MSPRKRIGVMIPSTNTTCEADFQMTGPRDVTIHGQRLWLTNNSNGDDAYVRMNGEIESGARYLATANVDVVVYGCTTGSFYKGPGWDTEMLELIRREARVPAVATSPSVVEALRFFGARRLSVATPYPEWNNQRLRAYLEAQGFEVLNVDGEPRAAASGNQGINDQDPEEVAEFAARVCRPQGGRAAPLLHRVALGRGHRGQRGAHRQARGELQPVHDLDRAPHPRHHPSDHRLRPAAGEPDSGVSRPRRALVTRSAPWPA
jgi:maleate isomerase